MNKPITSPKRIYHCLRNITMLLLFCFSTFSAFAQPSFCVSNETGTGSVTVDVTVENFNDILSVQFPIDWVDDVLEFDSISNFALPSTGVNFVSNAPDGLLKFAWFDISGLGFSLPDGAILFSITFNVLNNNFSSVEILENTLLSTPPFGFEVSNFTTTFSFQDCVIKPGAVNGVLIPVLGNIFNDSNLDCELTGSEIGLKNWILQINGANNFTRYVTTDSNGDYKIFLDTGSYVIYPQLLNNYWQFCQTSYNIDLVESMTDLEVNIPVQPIVECPVLEVDLSTWLLRRCFENKYTVNYCNIGTTTATDAFVEIELDEFLSVVSSTIPISSQNGNTYTFNLGDVALGDCGSFDMQVLVSCDADLGITHCSEAHIYPDEFCELPAGWSGASLEIIGECNPTNNTVDFTITNIGDEDMQNGTSSIVIEDAVMLFAPINIPSLLAGQSHIISIPSSGTTVRMELNQIPDHPGESQPSAVVEGCGTNDAGGFSTGFVNQFPLDEENPFISIDCRENIGAFDPNDKQAFPRGYGNLNYLKANTDIEYLIRFQNTGTDTAFNIVIRDTLSNLLNAASIRVGASSHPVDFELVGEGIAVFNFYNIMLPDSNINEAGSHGFVQFKIEQQPDLPDGTTIENDAAIFFDFNEPIITNTVFHTIGENFITVDTREIFLPNVTVLTFPNPFQDVVQFEIEGATFRSIELNIYDLTGRLIRTAMHPNSTFSFYRKNLTSGMYVYKLIGDGVPISSGKIMVD